MVGKKHKRAVSVVSSLCGRGHKLPYLVLVFLALTATVIAVGFSGYWSLITGAATSATTSVSITINSPPIINFTQNITTQSVTENSFTSVIVWFSAKDTDGTADLDNTTAQIRINTSSGVNTDRWNRSCTAVNSNPDAGLINYTCNVSLYYFDTAGLWTINVSIKDLAGVQATNQTNTFNLQSTTAMQMAPTALTWATLDLAFTNRTSNNDPITINNTGNANIAVGGVTLTAYDLQGATTTTDHIKAQNFSISTFNGTAGCTDIGCLECNGTQVSNGSSGIIAAANISAGNITINDQNGSVSGQEKLFLCLRAIQGGGAAIVRQVYNTAGPGTSTWTIAVS